MADEKRKVGRPSTYDAKYCEQVVALGAEGKSQHQISAALGIPLSTIRSWGDQHEEFSHALTRAKELEQAWWEDKAQDGLCNREFNAALWSKNVASRFRSEYGERQQVDHGVTNELAEVMKAVDGQSRGLPNGD